MLTVATYNILHGYHKELILKNIKRLIENGAHVICLQETELEFIQSLDEFFAGSDLKNWKIHYGNAGYGGNLALAWNTSILSLQNFETVLLPSLPYAVLLQRLKGYTLPLQRAALVGTFSVDGITLRISSVQLAWEGGTKFRMSQLAYLKDVLARSSADGDIIGGDFNTFVPSLFRRGQQNKVERVLGPQYINVLPDLSWTCDLSYIAPQDWWYSLAKIVRPLGIKMRTRLDYLLVRNLNIVSAKMLDWPGSDHRPLMGTFSF